MSGDNNLPHKVVVRLSEQMCKTEQNLTCTWQLRVYCCFTWLCYSGTSDKAIQLLICKQGNEDMHMIFSRSFPVLMSFDSQICVTSKGWYPAHSRGCWFQALQLTSFQEPECDLVPAALFPHVLSLEKKLNSHHVWRMARLFQRGASLGKLFLRLVINHAQ